MEWKKLKTKFFEYLGQRQEEWRTIKEKPLQYMPYMESCFQALTGIRLKGLNQFTGWIKPGSYYHGVVARKGQLHRCLHLAGTEPPRGLQISHSEKGGDPHNLHMPGKEGGVTQGARSDSPAPMETGGAGDGQSWAEQAEVSTKEEWRRGRPTKHRRSASRKREGQSTNPFPLQDSEGRREVVQQLYWHAGELTPARHNVAAQRIARQYPGMESDEEKSLNNQVLCMILILPPIEEYLADDSFHGTMDLRVEEKAKTLWVAVWLHRLDMAAAEDGTASLSLDITRHSRRPLLEFLLAPTTSSLMFEEVVQWVLAENRYKTESSLDNVQKLRDQLQRELKDLSQARRVESDKSSRKKIKRDMEWKQKDIKGLEVTISHYESSLRRAQVQPEGTLASEDDLSHSGAEGAKEVEMATTPVADDAPPVSAMPEPLTPPPGEEHTFHGGG